MARKPNATPPQMNGADPDGGEKEDDLIVVPDDGTAGSAEVEVKSDGVEQSVEELMAQLEAANQRAERETNARIEAEKRVNNAATQVADSNLQAIDNAINSAVTDKKSILSEITAAKEAGDYAKEAEALDRLQTTNIKLSRLSEGKAELERRIDERKEFDEQQRDPLEGYIAGAKLNSTAAAWVRQHPEVLLSNGQLDRSKLEELETAHLLAVSRRNGLTSGTPEYFAFIERELLGEGDEEEAVTTPTPKPNGARPPAARPSRVPDPTTNGGSRISLPDGVERLANGAYRLSAARRDAARISGMSDAEYLTNLLALQREGQLH